MKKLLSSVFVVFIIFLSKFIPFNLIIGSLHAHFSCTTITAPAIASHFGLSWIALFFVNTSIFMKTFSWFSLLHRVPLIFAAMTYRYGHWFFSFVVAAACMGLFVLHPVGGAAWPYSLYWLIPMALHTNLHSSWARALSAVFMAHAVGSVIWLYAGNICAEVWLALIPVVAIERLFMAAGIVVLDGLMVTVKKIVKNSNIIKKIGCV